MGPYDMIMDLGNFSTQTPWNYKMQNETITTGTVFFKIPANWGAVDGNWRVKGITLTTAPCPASILVSISEAGYISYSFVDPMQNSLGVAGPSRYFNPRYPQGWSGSLDSGLSGSPSYRFISPPSQLATAFLVYKTGFTTVTPPQLLDVRPMSNLTTFVPGDSFKLSITLKQGSFPVTKISVNVPFPSPLPSWVSVPAFVQAVALICACCLCPNARVVWSCVQCYSCEPCFTSVPLCLSASVDLCVYCGQQRRTITFSLRPGNDGPDTTRQEVLTVPVTASWPGLSSTK